MPQVFSGAKCRQLRQQAGLTYTEFGFHIGCAAETVRRYEASETEPSANRFAAIASVLEVDMAELLEEVPDEEAV